MSNGTEKHLSGVRRMLSVPATQAPRSRLLDAMLDQEDEPAPRVEPRQERAEVIEAEPARHTGAGEDERMEERSVMMPDSQVWFLEDTARGFQRTHRLTRDPGRSALVRELVSLMQEDAEIKTRVLYRLHQRLTG